MRIIINNESVCTAEEALDVVKHVIAIGRISSNNNQYCYASTFREPKVMVISSLLKNGDSFRIVDSKMV